MATETTQARERRKTVAATKKLLGLPSSASNGQVIAAASKRLAHFRERDRVVDEAYTSGKITAAGKQAWRKRYDDDPAETKRVLASLASGLPGVGSTSHPEIVMPVDPELPDVGSDTADLPPRGVITDDRPADALDDVADDKRRQVRGVRNLPLPHGPAVGGERLEHVDSGRGEAPRGSDFLLTEHGQRASAPSLQTRLVGERPDRLGDLSARVTGCLGQPMVFAREGWMELGEFKRRGHTPEDCVSAVISVRMGGQMAKAFAAGTPAPTAPSAAALVRRSRRPRRTRSPRRLPRTACASRSSRWPPLAGRPPRSFRRSV